MTHVEPFRVEDAVEIGGDEYTNHGKLAVAAGPGFTLMDGKTPVACGGVKIYGVGEAWFMMGKAKGPSVYKATREKLDEIVREHHLWRIFAEPKLEDMETARRFLSHLDFKPIEMMVK